MNKRIKKTLKLARKKFETFGFAEEQLVKLLESGKRDLIKELDKLKILLEDETLNMEEINKSIHGLKGLCLNLGNEKLADKLNEFRKNSDNEEELKLLYKYLKLDK